MDKYDRFSPKAEEATPTALRCPWCGEDHEPDTRVVTIDGRTGTVATLEPDTPVEVKGVRIEHHDGTGRLGIKYSSHEALAEADGVYAIVLYAEPEVAGQRRILVLAIRLVEPSALEPHLRRECDGYQKVRWDHLIDADEIDRERWGT